MMKICRVCKVEKPIEDFCRNRTMKDGINTKCRACDRIRYLSEKATEKKKQYNRARSRKQGTGFSVEEFNKKLEEQDYRCAICRTDTPSSVNWHADHDHDTKQKRGILCQKCNMGLGLFKDNVEALERAVMYLNHYNSTNNEVTL